MGPVGHLKNAHEFLKVRALKSSTLYENRIIQYMDKIFRVEYKTPIHKKMCILTH